MFGAGGGAGSGCERVTLSNIEADFHHGASRIGKVRGGCFAKSLSLACMEDGSHSQSVLETKVLVRSW